MPLFDFHCPKCDMSVELLVRFTDTPTCPNCNHGQLDRMVTGTSPPGQSKERAQSWRARASREGHLSNFHS